MTPRGAAWCSFKGFTDEHRSVFAQTLRNDPELMKKYFNAIEPHMLQYNMGTSMELENPPESSEERRVLFEQIAAHSKALHSALYELDSRGSEAILDRIVYKANFPNFDFDELKEPLMILSAITAHAATIKSGKEAGRPPDVVTYHFIWDCIREFEQVFGRKPKYTKGTKFQNFLKAVSKVVVRKEVALRGNITKRIEAALKHINT
jgi:hypothetical protein